MLFKAIKENNIEEVENLIKMNFNPNSLISDPNEPNEDKLYLPLQIACENYPKSIEIIQLLIKNGANINQCIDYEIGNNRIVRSYIFIEVLQTKINDENLFQLLNFFIKLGVDINSKKYLEVNTSTGTSRWTEINIKSAIHVIIENNKPDCLDILCENNSELEECSYKKTVELDIARDEYINEELYTPLSLACKIKSDEGYNLVKTLLKYGVKMNSKSKIQRTGLIGIIVEINSSFNPIHLALENNSLKSFALLVNSGANFNEKAIKDNISETIYDIIQRLGIKLSYILSSFQEINKEINKPKF